MSTVHAPSGAQYRGDLTEWDGITYSVTVDVPAASAHGADLELHELVQMTLGRLVSYVRSSRTGHDRRAAEEAAEDAVATNTEAYVGPDTTCPAAYAGVIEDGQVRALQCVLEVGHDAHHRAGTGVAWLSTIDPWAPPAPVEAYTPF